MADKVTFRFTGGDQFVADLGHWRDRLRAEVRQAAIEEANTVASITAASYPRRTGQLIAGVSVQDESAFDTVLVRVRSKSAHSHTYENGTGPRATQEGYYRGIMPKHPLFIPEAIRRRDVFFRRVRRILQSPEPSLGSGNPTVTGSL